MNQQTATSGNILDTAEINARVRDVVGSLVPDGRRDVQSIDRLTDLGFGDIETLIGSLVGAPTTSA